MDIREFKSRKAHIFNITLINKNGSGTLSSTELSTNTMVFAEKTQQEFGDEIDEQALKVLSMTFLIIEK